jgi:phage terminase large subunit
VKVLPAQLNPVLRAFWRTRARNRVLYGGRSSSKSWDAAGIAVQFARMCKIRILCTRQFQNKITESVYTLIKIQIERFGLQDEFDITNNSIKHKITGSEFLFYGLWRHIDEIKSLESIDILWVEEAHNLTETQWEILEPTIRKEGSQCWIIFNPRFATDFVYKRFVVNPPPDTVVQLINYTENPFLSKTILKVIAAKKAEDEEEYQHVYKGVPRDSDDKVVIKRSWIMASIDAHKNVKVVPTRGEWRGVGVTGYDVADDGSDTNATTCMDGSVCIALDEWKANTDELMKSSKRAHGVALINGSTWLGYDSIGVGAGTGSNLNEIGFRRHYRFNAGSSVSDPDKKYKDTKLNNKDYFENLKAQSWWRVAERFRNTFLAVNEGYQFAVEDMISIDAEAINSKLLNKLIDEMATPFRSFSKAGRVMVESKDDLKKRDVVSPNIADSFIIANSKSLTSKTSVSQML